MYMLAPCVVPLLFFLIQASLEVTHESNSLIKVSLQISSRILGKWWNFYFFRASIRDTYLALRFHLVIWIFTLLLLLTCEIYIPITFVSGLSSRNGHEPSLLLPTPFHLPLPESTKVSIIFKIRVSSGLDSRARYLRAFSPIFRGELSDRRSKIEYTKRF